MIKSEGNIPGHVAIIMDGNGRWAQQQGLNRTKGHERGAETVREITKACAADQHIQRLTLYAFSTENWKRPKMEVEFLMKLLERYLKQELPTYLENGIRFEPIGDLQRFSSSLQKTIDDVRRQTEKGDRLVQSLALNYGARDEMTRAIKKLAAHASEIDESAISGALDCSQDVDLMIRTGGDHRLSNFLLWQCAYAEFFFTHTLWPDFSVEEFHAILERFSSIERRFGGLN